MAAKEILLSRDGYEKLFKDLEFLKTVKRRECSKALEKARSYGDLSENAEYDIAKDTQAHNEKKIAELEDKLSRAQILDGRDIPKDEALIGAVVRVKDMASGEESEYALVSEEEADYEQGKISVSSPIGQGLLGRRVKETVSINVPAGTLKYKILKISR